MSRPRPARSAPRPARRALRSAAATLGLGLALTACSTGAPAPGTPSPTGAAVTVAHADTPLEEAVATVLERSLRLRGHPVTLPAEGAAAPERPWAEVGGDTVAVVDTLSLALAADPDAALPDVPEPSPTPTPTRSARASATASPSASASSASPTALPSGERAADAGALRGRVEEELSEASPRARVLAVSRDPLRLAAVVSATTAARLKLDSVDDLNARCEELDATAPEPVNSGDHPAATALLRARLDRLAGCRPAAWLPTETAALTAVVEDEAQVALAYPYEPDVQANALVVLADGERVLPEGQLAVLGDPEALDPDVQEAVRAVMDGLDEEGLRELARLSTGPDALEPEEAAQYWLISRGLEEAPEDWFVPRGSWF